MLGSLGVARQVFSHLSQRQVAAMVAALLAGAPALQNPCYASAKQPTSLAATQPSSLSQVIMVQTDLLQGCRGREAFREHGEHSLSTLGESPCRAGVSALGELPGGVGASAWGGGRSVASSQRSKPVLRVAERSDSIMLRCSCSVNDSAAARMPSH